MIQASVANPRADGSRRHATVFGVACWTLGLMVMAQAWIAGLALAARFADSKKIQFVERKVVSPILVEIPAHPTTAVLARPPRDDPRQVDDAAPSAVPLEVPSLADPRVERLIREAQQARVAGDMGLALIKLEEATAAEPDHALVTYELGMVHEQMGIYDMASSYYEQVFRMGLSKAGSLYQMAASKLRDGFELPANIRGKLSLGRVRIFKDPNQPGGEQVILTVPVQKAPDQKIRTDDIVVSVVFFNQTNRGEIVQLDDASAVREEWVSLPFDWAGGEENLRLYYQVPAQDTRNDHLFGKRAYYGQIVSLIYQGEVLDVQAWPRDLATRIPNTAQPDTPWGDDGWPFSADFDPDVPLLPPLPDIE